MEPYNIREVRSFHGLAIFYMWFIRNFSTIMAPITDCLKQEKFGWSKAAAKSFWKIKERMMKAHVMSLPIFLKVSKITCDASGIRVGGVLSQEKHHVAYLSEKLNDTRQRIPPMIRSSMR